MSSDGQGQPAVVVVVAAANQSENKRVQTIARRSQGQRHRDTPPVGQARLEPRRTRSVAARHCCRSLLRHCHYRCGGHSSPYLVTATI